MKDALFDVYSPIDAYYASGKITQKEGTLRIIRPIFDQKSEKRKKELRETKRILKQELISPAKSEK